MGEETDDDDDEEEFQRLFQDGRFWTFQGRANLMCCVIKPVEGLLNFLGWTISCCSSLSIAWPALLMTWQDAFD
ncbi:hypothetical protein QOT17_006554 [Balamuthia mandrillaris]